MPPTLAARCRWTTPSGGASAVGCTHRRECASWKGYRQGSRRHPCRIRAPARPRPPRFPCR
jgi:hypothetical protein